jgi:hypothetical protein
VPPAGKAACVSLSSSGVAPSLGLRRSARQQLLRPASAAADSSSTGESYNNNSSGSSRGHGMFSSRGRGRGRLAGGNRSWQGGDSSGSDSEAASSSSRGRGGWQSNTGRGAYSSSSSARSQGRPGGKVRLLGSAGGGLGNSISWLHVCLLFTWCYHFHPTSSPPHKLVVMQLHCRVGVTSGVLQRTATWWLLWQRACVTVSPLCLHLPSSCQLHAQNGSIIHSLFCSLATYNTDVQTRKKLFLISPAGPEPQGHH